MIRPRGGDPARRGRGGAFQPYEIHEASFIDPKRKQQAEINKRKKQSERSNTDDKNAEVTPDSNSQEEEKRAMPVEFNTGKARADFAIDVKDEVKAEDFKAAMADRLIRMRKEREEQIKRTNNAYEVFASGTALGVQVVLLQKLRIIDENCVLYEGRLSELDGFTVGSVKESRQLVQRLLTYDITWPDRDDVRIGVQRVRSILMKMLYDNLRYNVRTKEKENLEREDYEKIKANAKKLGLEIPREDFVREQMRLGTASFEELPWFRINAAYQMRFGRYIDGALMSDIEAIYKGVS